MNTGDAGTVVAHEAWATTGGIGEPDHERMTEFPLLVGLRPAYLDVLASAATEVRYSKRARLFFQDEPAVGCWLVSTGRVAIDSIVLGRGPSMVGVVGPGDIAGWSWLVPPYRWRFGAVALTPVTALRLDTGALRAAMADDVEFSLTLTEIMLTLAARRAEAADARFVDGHPSMNR